MAYTTYTPTADKFDDVDVPDDSELETSGIGAMDTPVETLADGLLWASEMVDITLDTYADSPTSVFDCDSATSVGWQDTPITLDVAANVGDRILVTFMFGVDPNSATSAYLDVFSSDSGAEVPETNQFLAAAKEFGPVTLTFAVQALATATITFTVRGKCAAGNFLLYHGTGQAIRVSRI